MIRAPLPTLESLRDAILDIVRFLRDMPRFDIVSIEVIAVPSNDVEALLTSKKFKTLYGAVQIRGTTTDVPTISDYDNSTVRITYSFDASTTGKQTYRFFMIGV